MTKPNRQRSVADALKATPGQWGKAGTYNNVETAVAMASRIRTGTASRRWEPAGACESYWVERGERFLVYGRYVGGAGSGTTGGAE
jgi:hypothetical protein